MAETQPLFANSLSSFQTLPAAPIAITHRKKFKINIKTSISHTLALDVSFSAFLYTQYTEKMLTAEADYGILAHIHT